tara:strand:- start:11826 stop:12281 length:456 start_codon:yes stop_codon:yes gene_type:complete
MACGSVPNTNTFSLSDVITQVSCFTSDYTITDLQAAFTAGNLNSGYFDSTYEEDKDELNDFRNYKFRNNTVTLTSFSSSAGSNSQSSVCQYGSINQTYYHDGSNATPVVGDNVYSDSAGTTGLARNHYKVNALGSYHIQTGGSTVDSTAPC